MKAIALITDFGLEDNYVGVMKGVMLGINSKVRFIDISHSISSYNVKEAAFLLAGSFSYFPKNTVFLVVVDPGVGSARKPIAIKTKNYYFVGPDNGVLSVAAGADGIEKVAILRNKRYFLPASSFTFHGRNIFSPVAAYLSKNITFSSLGENLKKIEKIEISKPNIKEGILEGEIIYVDKFGNLVTNIKKGQLKKILGKNFIGILKNKKIKRIVSCYEKGNPNEPFLIDGGFGYLEISLKNKSARKYFGIKDNVPSKVIIKS